MGSRQIIYYECENPSCGLRFPELREGLPRERCPMCRGRVRIAMAVDYRQLMKPLLSLGLKNTPVMEGLLDNIRSGLNVGSIFRSADGIGISKLYLCGITPSPDNAAVKKTALGAETSVGWEMVNNGVVKAMQLKAAGYRFGDWRLHRRLILSIRWEIKYLSSHSFWWLGMKYVGLTQIILELCERIVSIPMVGKKRSYNVATAFGIAASYLRYCQIFSQGSERRLPNTRLTP